jgi:hypothetical protein
LDDPEDDLLFDWQEEIESNMISRKAKYPDSLELP